MDFRFSHGGHHNSHYCGLRGGESENTRIIVEFLSLKGYRGVEYDDFWKRISKIGGLKVDWTFEKITRVGDLRIDYTFDKLNKIGEWKVVRETFGDKILKIGDIPWNNWR